MRHLRAALLTLALGCASDSTPAGDSVLFVTTTTFRGRITFINSFDRNRLSISPEAFTAALRDEVAALTGGSRP